MGNSNICCKDSVSKVQETEKFQIVQVETLPVVPEPAIEPSQSSIDFLPPWILQVVQQSNLFKKELLQFQKSKIHFIGAQRYVGLLDQNELLTGFGFLMKKDNTYYLGYFLNGKASGLGIYFFSSCSYYIGQMIDNKAQDDHGFFKNDQIEYSGGFQNNLFHGLGHETGKYYFFNGFFEKGFRKQGQLKWSQEDAEFIYNGLFDQEGKFNQRGKLVEPLGYYEGEFISGKKQGYGICRFKSGLRYEGYYKDNKRHGRGQIINRDGTIAFAGQFRQGMPLGKGYTTDLQGNKTYIYLPQQDI